MLAHTALALLLVTLASAAALPVWQEVSVRSNPATDLQSFAGSPDGEDIFRRGEEALAMRKEPSDIDGFVPSTDGEDIFRRGDSERHQPLQRDLLSDNPVLSTTLHRGQVNLNGFVADTNGETSF